MLASGVQNSDTHTHTHTHTHIYWGFPGGLEDKASAYNAGDLGSIPGWKRSPGEGNGNSLWYSCWKIPWKEEPGRLQSMGSQRVEHD